MVDAGDVGEQKEESKDSKDAMLEESSPNKADESRRIEEPSGVGTFEDGVFFTLRRSLKPDFLLSAMLERTVVGVLGGGWSFVGILAEVPVREK